MCLPAKNDQSDVSAPGTRSIVGLGALMLAACLAGPALAGALGVDVLVGAGGAALALGLCAAIPTVVVLPSVPVMPMIVRFCAGNP